MTDARFEKTEQRIQSALAELLMHKSLTDVGVSELAREAQVSRATFYAHYDNVGDVFAQLVQEVMGDVLTFDERFSCDGGACQRQSKPPYCERVRQHGRLSGAIGDPQFFSAMMALAWEDSDAAADAQAAGISKNAMRAVRLFQMSGCHTVATSEFAKQADWEQTRAVIDAFIEGGMKAIRGL